MRIVSLRLAVGLLGEREVSNWWRSGFMPTTAALLVPFSGPAHGKKPHSASTLPSTPSDCPEMLRPAGESR
jgi:hypothetical protein